MSKARPRFDVRHWQRWGAELEEDAQGFPIRPGITGKGKTGRVKCAVRRSVVSPIQSGRTWKNVPGSNG